MSPLSKVWAKWLLVGQYSNALLMLLLAFASATVPVEHPTVGPLLATWKAYALQIHAGISAAIGTGQALAKALPDRDGDGTPDLFDDTPDGPPAGAG